MFVIPLTLGSWYPRCCAFSFHVLLQTRTLVKVRLKWVKNKGLDHVIDKNTDLKAVCLLKNAIKRSSHGYLSSKFLAEFKRPLGLTVPVLRFLRRYPTIFYEFPDTRYANLPCFRLTDTARLLDDQEQKNYDANELNIVERISRVLMMSKSKALPLRTLIPLKWDLGLPDDFIKVLIPKYPDHFQVIKQSNGLVALGLTRWRDEFAVSSLQNDRGNAEKGTTASYRDFKKGSSLKFPMRFPRGYGEQKKVKAWMDEFHKLPYISPYEDCSSIDPESDLMEKRVVGLLHEFLGLMVHKMTKRNYLRSLREELNLPHKFTRIFTRYPGIFYFSLKCKSTTVVLKEGYEKGKVVNPDPLIHIRDKYSYVMRTGIMYRAKGDIKIPERKDGLNCEEGPIESGSENEEDEEVSDDCYSADSSDLEKDSSEEENNDRSF